ncbi:hypothetical protein BBJ28_00025035 [Nothophytophthora sp. Chile5]|nr:hypothetical protein BBJ28_00025035 [Nothophytophthora sp. Chile5]
MPTSMPSFAVGGGGADGGDSSSDDSDVTEGAFMSWLVDQKKAGKEAGQMLDALGLGVSEGVAVDDDELWEAMLSMGIRLIRPSVPQRAREKLENVNTLQDVAALLQSSKKIVVLAGAGISVSCGIPDFRSENGIYSVYIEFFRSNPRPFFAFAKELFPQSSGFTFVPSRSHYFLKLLEDKGKLLRIYSQVIVDLGNIDMPEHAAGISHERSVLCHGSFATATCLSCKRMYPNDAIREDVLRQQVPMCQACKSPDGIIKPDIVFFGESLPRRFHDSIKSDEREADLVLVMGSSLKVNPVRSIVGRFQKDTPMILINRNFCRLLEWEIPQPDPVLLGQSDLPPTSTVAANAVTPLSIEFVPPSRHLFNGSKSTYCSSSDDDDGSSSSGGVGTGADAEIDATEPDDAAVALDADEERKASPVSSGEGEGEGDQDELMGSGNELLGSSIFEEN